MTEEPPREIADERARAVLIDSELPDDPPEVRRQIIKELAVLMTETEYREKLAQGAKRADMDPDDLDRAVRAARVDGTDRPVPCSEDELAVLFSERHGHELRYVATESRWRVWNGTYWAEDRTRVVDEMVRRVCRAEAPRIGTALARFTKDGFDPAQVARNAKSVASRRTIAAVEQLARADRAHAATTDQWDTDPWLLNTPGGTVELRMGKVRPSDPADHLTKVTACAPDDAPPELWLDTLETITDGDRDLEDYLQRVAGYCLTGSTDAHVLFFGHGTGANGKSVVVSTIAGILGDYAATAPMETFTSSRFDRHPTELAMLRGARLVTATETEEGRPWSESRIKQLTGGDRIAARHMRQDFFEFTPQFKLLIVGNHRPGLRSTDEAIRRRLHLIPFNVTIPPDERDPELTERLRDEWPSILRWMIDGCLQWQRVGLAPPASVVDASEEYLADEDTIGRWISECCVKNMNERGYSRDLYDCFKRWAEENGEPVISNKMLSRRLKDRGFRHGRSRFGAFFFGLRAPEQDD